MTRIGGPLPHRFYRRQSTTSGASWFSTQFFFSPAFYDRVILAESPEELGGLVEDWMKSYRDISSDVDEGNTDKCNKLEKLGSFATESCAIALEHGGSWANFVDAMLESSGAALGDPSFFTRIASPENRNEPLAGTDLIVQTALMPNSRYVDGESGVDYDTFLGFVDADGGDPNLLTCPVPARYVVEDSGAGFRYGVEDLVAGEELQAYVAPAPPDYDTEDWAAFYLEKPAPEGTLTIRGSTIGIDGSSHAGPFAPPYGGPATTNVVQLAADSSAAGGYPSPAMPSVYAQFMTTTMNRSMEGYASGWTKLLLGIVAGLAAAYLTRSLILCRNKGDGGYESVPDTGSGNKSSNCPDCCSEPETCMPICCCLVVGAAVFTFYSFGSILIPLVAGAVSDFAFGGDDLDGLSICSSWPEPCGPNDGQFSDGLFADGPAVAANVGHHLRTKGVDPGTTLKLILTNTNELANWNGTLNIGSLCQ